MFEKHKVNLIVGAIGFLLGYGVSILSSRGQLPTYDARIEQCEVLYRHYQAREAGFNQLADLHNQLAASRRTVAELRESIKRSSITKCKLLQEERNELETLSKD